ncbi:hypothetical protein LOZ39_004537 [Ophidiomyces ophidiicola]|uniref:Uncharacterized protein n=1 Tax=Ophidiomyces ophidiicola TaxID=1387563 RepID=A0ACB8UPP9_9EURO|nr:hypothetical protein LOZ61_005164 [Ophidiomyces ophidiicola]KAI1911393.1 hypothetical protein LOZ64_004722 [Ophidiomyces ophidiicola]KAI1930947.1 hypothetical protein LOZ60_000607 [Ophidiomyces ophidiicola]KAI1954420.1 hypothetical protein LOZ59_004944 [Ophidiomyces ophidiicola]KAI1967949.1 hypothetical protein LOZ56_005276 [Ophidiomyces ophidiicola]
MDDLNPILSPSKARQAASQAKDWAYVTSWLNRKYTNSPNPIPKFERNEDTLKVLLNIAAANDAADEDEALAHRTREETIGLLNAELQKPLDPKLKVLDDIQDSLDDQSAKLIEDLAETGLFLGVLESDIQHMSLGVLNMTREEFDTAEQLRKLESIQTYLGSELIKLQTQLAELKDKERYETPADLPSKTSEWLRNKRIAEAKAKEYQSRTAAIRGLSDIESPKIDDVIAEEEETMKLEENVKKLENNIKDFHGLPTNFTSAKSECQRLSAEHRVLVQRRDRLFEGLVGSRGR